MGRHPNRDQFSGLTLGRLSRRRTHRIVRHLLAGCLACRRIAAASLPSGFRAASKDDPTGQSGSGDYSAAFAAARARCTQRLAVVERERAEAPELLREIAVQPFYRQWVIVTDNPRFRTWSFCELLLDACREWGFQDPARALQMARLGVELSDRLDRETYGEARVNDLRARAWAGLGNAERIVTDFRAAEKSFARAHSLLRKGTGDPLERAHLLILAASLDGHRQRFPAAFASLERAVRIAERCGDRQLAGKALVTHGFLAGVANDPERALLLLQQGLALIDREAEPRLFLAGRHNLILGLCDSGRLRDAIDLLEKTRPLYRQMGDRLGLTRLAWIEGRIELAFGRLDRAEALFLQVRNELVGYHLGYDVALLSLDLAQVYAQQGRGADMRRLAEEMLPIFQSREIHREAVSALIVFQRAAAMERVSLGLVQELSAYLQESRSAPGLRFREAV